MKKHKFNIFPEAKPEDFARLLDDIRANGFDRKQPIVTYQGDILDGWNRHRACDQLEVQPDYIEFTGTDGEALAYVMRSNKRRNLNSGQWATIAAEADELMTAIRASTEKERREKQATTQARPIPQKIVEQPKKDHKAETAHKVAAAFNTNRTYVTNAIKMKREVPEVFEKVKAGTMTMQDGMKALRAIPKNPWLTDEEERRKAIESGRSVIANSERDKNLIQWAEKQGLAVRIDRSSKYGNPFVLDDDGSRDEVCDHYESHYLPHKPSIHEKLDELRGKVLICHCYPQRCHGEALLKLIG